MIAVQKLGIPTGPPMVLTVPGRKTGRPRSTPMTPFTFGGHLYVWRDFPVPIGRATPAPPVLGLLAGAARNGK
ncbi:deazaflavin-dependent nitroreductase family protein [Mycobacterium xenopi]|nr:deazaflavin-dependent nitroreductase family protein [Mycobacterium xenopi]